MAKKKVKKKIAAKRKSSPKTKAKAVKKPSKLSAKKPAKAKTRASGSKKKTTDRRLKAALTAAETPLTDRENAQLVASEISPENQALIDEADAAALDIQGEENVQQEGVQNV